MATTTESTPSNGDALVNKPSESSDSSASTQAQISNGNLNGNDNNNNSNNYSRKGSNNNNSKSRRPVLPLPDPIPEEPLKPYDPPSKEEHLKKVEEENVKLQECYARLNHTRTFKEERQKIRDASRPAFEAARKEFQQINDECRSLFEEHKSITTRMKELRENVNRNASQVFNEPTGAGKDGNEALKDIKTMNDLEKRIDEYKYRLETESMPILEEKKIVSKISFLTHKGRDFIKERDQAEQNVKAENAARKASRTELEERRKVLDVEIDKAKATLEEKKTIVDKIRAEQQEEERKLSEATPKVDRNEEKKKITEIKANIAKLRDDFGKELDEWFLNKRIIVEQQKIARRKKYEAIQAEREEKRRQWEAEQAQYPEPHPYQAEKDMCSGLTVYLKTLLGETIEKPSLNLRGSEGTPAKPSLKANGTTREISTPSNPIGKSVMAKEDGFSEITFSDFVKKPKRGKKSRKSFMQTEASTPAVNDENSALKPHSIDYLTAFSKLGIKAPNKLSEVRGALEAVKEKAAFYETAPAPSEEEKAKKDQNKQKDGRSKGGNTKAPTPNGVDLMNGDANAAFPGLGSDGNRGPSKAIYDSLPSFKAVASGDYQASAIPVSSITGDMENMAADDADTKDDCEPNDEGNVKENGVDGAADDAEGNAEKDDVGSAPVEATTEAEPAVVEA